MKGIMTAFDLKMKLYYVFITKQMRIVEKYWFVYFWNQFCNWQPIYVLCSISPLFLVIIHVLGISRAYVYNKLSLPCEFALSQNVDNAVSIAKSYNIYGTSISASNF